MKLKYEIILGVIILSKYLCIDSVIASALNAISVTNNVSQATVTLNCTVVPIYMVFSLHDPERIVIDLLKIPKIHNNTFPVKFNGLNLVQSIRTNMSVNHQSVRIVLDLICPVDIVRITQEQIGVNYQVILTILKKKTSSISNVNIYTKPRVVHNKTNFNVNQITNDHKKIIDIQFCRKQHQEKKLSPIIVAIDAGHGGQDPGATGSHGIYEKNITINIAKKLKTLLDLDPRFKAVMIRDGDYFLSVMERSNVARKRRANVLISIHADSALNTNVTGASVWVLSNSRAKSEMMQWLQCSDKHSEELLGGLGDILTSYRSDPYIRHLVLDLQFGYAQRVGYDIALHVLHQLKNVTSLHKVMPEYSSFGILRSPDIPSILVETGFISNIKEEHLLSSNGYQEKIAHALYKGLRDYFISLQKKPLDHSRT